MAEKVGTLLVESSRLTQAQADEAHAHALHNGVSLSNALVALDMVTDVEIAGVLAIKYRLPSVDLSRLSVDPGVWAGSAARARAEG